MKAGTFQKTINGEDGKPRQSSVKGYHVSDLPTPWNRYKFFVYRSPGYRHWWQVAERTTGRRLGETAPTRVRAIKSALKVLIEQGEERFKAALLTP